MDLCNFRISKGLTGYFERRIPLFKPEDLDFMRPKVLARAFRCGLSRLPGEAAGEPGNRAKPLMKEKGMGLDMYLTGEECVPYERRKAEDSESDASPSLKSRNYHLGYWRKHPNLHGYIVANFDDGIDECDPVPLNPENIQQIVAAVREDSLPRTTGFFFGESVNDDAQKREDIAIFEAALQWLQSDDWNRSVYYQASW